MADGAGTRLAPKSRSSLDGSGNHGKQGSFGRRGPIHSGRQSHAARRLALEGLRHDLRRGTERRARARDVGSAAPRRNRRAHGAAMILTALTGILVLAVATPGGRPMHGKLEELAVGSESVRLYVTGADTAPGVVVFHPWWGLNEDVLAYADRLAAQGFYVVAPDLVRRRVATTIEAAESLASGADQSHADSVALAAIDRLTSRGRAKVGTLGFSFGAAWALWSAAKRPAVAATVVYYGTLGGPSLTKSAAPVVGHFAEKDPYESDESVDTFKQALRNAGRNVTIYQYQGTGHWFAEPSRDAWREKAADLAFERTVAFLQQQLGATRRAK